MMIYDLILSNIARHVSLDEKEKKQFSALLDEKDLSKKELILQEGQLCRSIYFVNTGALRAYYIDRHGKESTVMFAVKDWWITDMYCFVNQAPAMLCIEAIENSNVLSLSKEDLETLYTAIPKFEKFFRIMMQNAYTREQLRSIQNLSLTAEERYDQFLEKYPQIVQQVTQKQIASYLGITPEFLSAIRANKNRKSIS